MKPKHFLATVGALVLAIPSISRTTEHSAFGADQLITAPAPITGTQQPAASPYTFRDIRPGGQPLVIYRSQGTMIRLSGIVRTVFVADADVADVNVLPQGDTVYVFGRKPGATVLYITDDAGNIMLNRGVEVQDLEITTFRGSRPAGPSGPRPLILQIPLQPSAP